MREALSGSGEALRSSLTSALEAARAGMGAFRAEGNGRPSRTADELGGLALGPLDARRFESLLDSGDPPDPASRRHMEQAVAVLESAVRGAGSLDEVTVAPGQTLRDAVARALEDRGRAFGAVRTLALLRSGAFREEEHAQLLDGLPFREWRSLERDLACPLLVAVQGSELDTVGGLAEFLDGKQKIVLRLQGPSPPAPLARLLAPGVLVLQSSEAGALERVVAFQGPAVAALVPESAARFVHDPATSDGEGSGNVEIHHLPDVPPRSWAGGMSPAQQTADLRLLEHRARASLGAAPQAPGAEAQASTRTPEDPSPPSSPDPADRLAAWLLEQATLDDDAGS